MKFFCLFVYSAISSFTFFINLYFNVIGLCTYMSRLMVVRRVAKKLRSARPIKRRGHYCELFMCRVGFAILALDYATSLSGFVLGYVTKIFSCRCFLVTLLK